MTRVILFRGKDNDGQWVCGDHVSNVVLATDCSECEHAIRESSKYPVGVNPDTIGQFTGAYDKNATPIFEGDRLECGWCRGVVVYDGYGFELDEDDDSVPLNQLFPFDNVMVVGNIHDKKE